MSNEIFRGQVYFMDLGQRIGSEQSGMRPVIIVQNDTGNRRSPTVIIVPITSQIKKENLPTHISLRSGHGLEENSIALCEHVNTIDKQRLLDYVGHITTMELRQVDRALAISVGLVESYNKPWIDGPRPKPRIEESDTGAPDELRLCLCPTCASQFYNSPDHIIRRVDPLQTDKEDCTYCNVRKGVDYRINKKKKRLGDDRVQEVQRNV